MYHKGEYVRDRRQHIKPALGERSKKRAIHRLAYAAGSPLTPFRQMAYALAYAPIVVGMWRAMRQDISVRVRFW